MQKIIQTGIWVLQEMPILLSCHFIVVSFYCRDILQEMPILLSGVVGINVLVRNILIVVHLWICFCCASVVDYAGLCWIMLS